MRGSLVLLARMLPMLTVPIVAAACVDEAEPTGMTTLHNTTGAGEASETTADASTGPRVPGPSLPPPLPNQSASCKRYIACTEAVMHKDADTASQMYGPSSECWQATSNAETCDTACSTALAALLSEREAAKLPIPEACDPPQALAWSEFEDILQESCVDECHEPGGSDISLDLSDDPYGALYFISSDQSALLFIDPGDHEASYLWHKLRGSQGSQGGMGSRMPKDADPLPDATIERLAAWIDAGAPL